MNVQAGDPAYLASDTPEVLIDLTILTQNIQRAAEAARCSGIALRPHIKTHKMPHIARMQIDAGAVGIQVAKLGEAEVMAAAGVRDILIGYPIVGSAKLQRLVKLAEIANISVSLDSLAVAEGISQIAHAHGLAIQTLIEIDTGLQRLGCKPGIPSADLAEQVASLRGIEFAGIFTHEGQLYGDARSPSQLGELTRDVCRTMVETAETIRARGLAVGVVSVGSAATFRHSVSCPGITEVRPGTYVFNDRTQIALEAATADDVAATVVATVVSRPVPERVVLDAGSKVLTSDPMLVARPDQAYGAILGHPGWRIARLSEEHAVVEIPADAAAHVGMRLRIVPNHICPVINLADAVTIIENDAVVDRWPVAARGRVR